MKKTLSLLLIALGITLAAANAGAKTGTVVYSLPKTSLVLEVEAVCEHFHAGPYAQYAKKYLGIDARTENSSSYTVSQVKIIPRIEADLSATYELNLEKNSIAEKDFLKITSQGLIVMTDSFTANEKVWRFPAQVQEDGFNNSEVNRSYTSENIELFKMVKKNGQYEKVAVQSQAYTQKTTERKALEIAETIFNLRKKREEIITGDTDAVFDGEALGAAISEINRLESEYLSLFIGYTEYSVQRMSFDFIPENTEEHLYVAFRISDTNGLLPADNMSGRPVVATLEIENQNETEETTEGKQVPSLYYRIPAVATVKIMDQTTLITQSRIPFYQFGTTASIPVTFIK